MSARLGVPASQVIAAAAVTANGRVITYNKAVVVASLVGVWVATATVGGRTVQMQVKDAAGNILLRLPLNTTITAGQTVNIVAVNGATIANFATTPLIQTLPLPADMPVPDGGSITLVDTSNIDPADTCSIATMISN